MTQINSIFSTLKSALKAHGITYADLAKRINLSEATIKRIFAEENLSISRLEQISQVMNMEISDIISLMKERQFRLTQLTEEQELEIARDPLLILVGVCVLNRWELGDITSKYNISEYQCVQKLARLDRLKIIELLPNNRIKLLVSPNFQWRKNGPMLNVFRETIGREFFKTNFVKENEMLVVLNGTLSRNSALEFHKKIDKLAQDFENINLDDTGVPMKQKSGVTAVLAIRNWQFGAFESLQK
jgi:transcriptional regulator with XRE-family HTH domain